MTGCAAAIMATPRPGKISKPPTTPNSNSRRRSRASATCSIGCGERPSPCSSPRDETRNNAVALKEWLDEQDG